MLKLLVISDIHSDLNNLSRVLNVAKEARCNLVICCGDLESLEGVEMLSRCGLKSFTVTGNMDWPEVSKVASQKGISIENRVVEEGGYRFIGVSGLKHASSSVKAYELARSSEGPIILVSHHPPYGTKVDIALSGVHIGSKYVRKIVEDCEVILLLAGHVHEARGVDKLGETLIINPGPLFMGYYALVELPSLKYELLEL
ncbi:MAG: metallophosphoesterase [Thermofilum sp. ex4484_15]|nr:MAG: metallophosphoesterase [Thermofilum sp. ex4484_15]